MAQCTVEECSLNGEYEGKCALHCDKKDYQNDRRSGVLAVFLEDLIHYLYDELEQIPTSDFHKKLDIQRVNHPNNSDKDLLKLVLINDASNVFDELFIEQEIVFRNIWFPERKGRDYFDYFKLFKKFKGIHFDFCDIYFTEIDVQELELFFQDCNFKNDWSINSYSVLDNVNKVIFQNCKFLSRVNGYLSENAIKEFKVKCQLFNDCEFFKSIVFDGITFEKSIFNNSEDHTQNLNRLMLNKCTFNERFLLNNGEYNELIIENTEFQGKVELKNNSITKTK